MRRSRSLFPIALALGMIILTPRAGAQQQDARGQEPIKIKKCQTISEPGSYRLVNNLIASGSNCLVITADFVTIDLAGFSIGEGLGAGITASGSLKGITVRNGSISRSGIGVDLHSATGSIVEGLRVFDSLGVGIIANGIVKGNSAVGAGTGPLGGPVIGASGIVTGNYVSGSRNVGLDVGQGSTVIGNTATGNFRVGIRVSCPSNVTDNTAVNSVVGPNLVLNGEGCNNTNNVAP